MRIALKRAEYSLSPRGKQLAKEGQTLSFFKGILNNPYHPDDNPDGFVNIGTAENVRPSLPYQSHVREAMIICR